jgi:hypothetical protein
MSGVSYAVYVYNTSTHVATGYTLFELLYGFKLELSCNLRGDPNPQYNYDDFLVELKSRLQTAQQTAREWLIMARHKSKEYYDKHMEELSIKIGNKVLLYDETVQRGGSRKLCSLWLGPYGVISKCKHQEGKNSKGTSKQAKTFPLVSVQKKK